jgi:hypothetical protein
MRYAEERAWQTLVYNAPRRGKLSAMSKSSHRGRKPAVNPKEQWRQLSAQVAEARDHRRRALQGDEPVVKDLAALLFREDPMGIAFGPDDEYLPEADTIALRLPHAKNLDGVRRQVHEAFVHWFGADLAGEPARYDSIAQAVLAIWHRHHPLDVPRAIRVMAAPGCWPTWDDDTGRNLDPVELPISRSLAAQLTAWAKRHDLSLTGDDGPASELAAPQALLSEGRLLADQLTRELANIAVVHFREPPRTAG